MYPPILDYTLKMKCHKYLWANPKTGGLFAVEIDEQGITRIEPAQMKIHSKLLDEFYLKKAQTIANGRSFVFGRELYK